MKTYMGVEGELFELREALERLVAFFEPSTDSDGYVVWEDGEPLARIGGELAEAVDHANEILYGEGVEFDED